MAAFVVVVVLLLGCSTTIAAPYKCPIDFSYVARFPPHSCSIANQSTPTCCSSTFNKFGIGIALHLRQSHHFSLPNIASVNACFLSYQSALHSCGIPPHSFLPCSFFRNPSPFVTSPTLCSGIETVTDWQHKVGFTPMDISCAGDLSDSAACDACTTDVVLAISKTSILSSHNSSCLYFSFFYAAAMVNKFGPTNPSTAFCLLRSKATSVQSHPRAAVYVAIGAVIVIIEGCVGAIWTWLWCLRKRQLYRQSFVKRNKKILRGSLHPNVGAIWYKFEDIKAATSNFAEGNVIGLGGFATVYKGVMPDGSQVAVKRIKNCTPEGDAEFRNEVDVINSIRHRNLIALRGCCVASNTSLGHLRLLIYDYMPNGSLEDYLFSVKKPLLTWPERRKIALGAARGIAYLHNAAQPAIIHRDIKANNILLDEDLNAHVADFGLAKITEDGMTHMTTRVAGTQGYLAPEYALFCQLTEKSDVYSFGVLLLVLMSGKQALDVRRNFPLITDWAWAMVKAGKSREVLDERIRDDDDDHHAAALMEKFVLVGILCAHLLVAFRPTMSEALKMLQGDVDIPPIPDRPVPLTHESLHSSEDTSYIQ